MTIAAGVRLGSYEILAPLGAGGMGEVYRARDTKLGREVAVKVLPAHLSNDQDALARFEREARAVAALSHPNILAIHDFGLHAGTAYAVMELLEGETLRQRLTEGPLSVRRATDFGVQITSGLAAAHAKGIVHRDLKPENVFVTKDGRVKILDFGLARQTAPSSGSDTRSPTSAGATDAGTVLGTVGYMSPEQVRGLPADQRSDIFSFGTVLFEMLTGRRAFQHETAAETMTAILKEEPPDVSGAGSGAPPALDRIVRHCLEKSPEERFQSARDVAFDLTSVAGDSGVSRGVAAPAGPRARSRKGLAVFGALLAGLLLGAGLLTWLRPAVEPLPIRVRALTFSSRDSEPSASPDGRLIAFSSARDGVSRIWIKQLTGGGEAPLTAGPDRSARFSPDGSSVLFLRDLGATKALYRIALVGGEPRKIADNVIEADWSPDGRRIVVARIRGAAQAQRISTIAVLETDGGKETVLTEIQGQDIFNPRWSPDGRTIAFVLGDTAGNVPTWQLFGLDVASRRIHAIGKSGPANPLGGVAWSGQGRELFFVRAGSVVGDISGAQARLVRCDVETGLERAMFWGTGLFPLSAGSIGVSAHADVLGPGRILFDQRLQRQNLREVSSTGGAAAGGARLLTRGSSQDRQPAYSPDGKRVIFSSNRSGNLDLWVLDLETGALRQLTDDVSQDWDPGFTPDGKHVVWSCDRGGHLEIWIANADGSAGRQLTRDGLDAENPAVTRDGAWIYYWSGNVAKPGIWKIRPDGTSQTRLIAGRFLLPEVSPDGRYLTYLELDRANQLNTIHVAEAETGRAVNFTILVPYRLGGPRINFGRMRWTPDGRSILHVGQDAADLSGVFAQDFVPGRDTSASRRAVAGFSPEFSTESFGISPDGSRLLLSTLEESSSIMLAEGVPGAMPPARKGTNP